MVDDLELKLRSIRGSGPSPDFVANLREQVEAELAKSAVITDDEHVVKIDFWPKGKERAMTRTRWILLGAAAAAIALIVGFGTLGNEHEEGQLETVNTPEESQETAKSVTQDYSLLGAGQYRVETVGTPFTFESTSQLFVQPNGQAFFVLTHPLSQGEGDREIVFMRLTALWDPARLSEQSDESGAGWPAEDFGGWIDSLPEGVVASNSEETVLGGLAATRADLEIDLSVCGDDPEFCIGFGRNGLVNFKSLGPGEKYRIWVVEQEDQAPLAVIVGIRDESDIDWFDTAERILSTLEFGDVSPNPILRLPAGLTELSYLGGIRVDLAQEMTVIEDTQNLGRVMLDGQPADTEFLIDLLDLEGDPIETADDLVSLLIESNVAVTETGSATIGGIEARIFEITGRSGGPVFKRNPEDERGWRPPPRGQLWLLEHPERGLLMVNAEVYDSGQVETVFPLILAQTEEILGSLVFIEPG